MEKVVTCPVCSGGKFNKAFKAKDYNQNTNGTFGVVICDSCGVAVTSPRPREQDIGSFYPDHYWGDEVPQREELLKNYQEIYSWILSHKKPKNSILDIGAGGGYFLSLFNKNFDRLGIEFSKQAALMGERNFGLKILSGDLKSNYNSIKDTTFDFVTMNNVLEHLYDPKKELRMVHSLLKDDGYLIISVPNFNSINSRFYKQYWYHLDPPRHVVHYSAKTLAYLLSSSGFDIKEKDYRYYAHNVVGLRNSQTNKHNIKSSIGSKLLNKASIWTGQFTSRVNLSDVITVYASKRS